MKKSLLSGIVLGLLCFSALNGAEGCDDQAQKWYCDASQIVLADTTILIAFDEGIIEVDTLHVDQGGIFVSTADLRCPNCHRPCPSTACETPNCGYRWKDICGYRWKDICEKPNAGYRWKDICEKPTAGYRWKDICSKN